MKTTPTGKLNEMYKKITKGELFFTAWSYYQLKYPNTGHDLEGFRKFCKQEMKLYGDQDDSTNP